MNILKKVLYLLFLNKFFLFSSLVFSSSSLCEKFLTLPFIKQPSIEIAHQRVKNYIHTQTLLKIKTLLLASSDISQNVFIDQAKNALKILIQDPHVPLEQKKLAKKLLIKLDPTLNHSTFTTLISLPHPSPTPPHLSSDPTVLSMLESIEILPQPFKKTQKLIPSYMAFLSHKQPAHIRFVSIKCLEYISLKLITDWHQILLASSLDSKSTVINQKNTLLKKILDEMFHGFYLETNPMMKNTFANALDRIYSTLDLK